MNKKRLEKGTPCKRGNGLSKGRDRQRISLADLPLPATLPEGAEWILAYRYGRTAAM